MTAIEPSGQTLGATVLGMDLAKPLSDADFATILQALGRHGVLHFPGQKLEAVELRVSPTTLRVANQLDPTTGLAGKFSVTYCAATALARGRVAEADFADDAVREPHVRALAARVRVEPVASLDEMRAQAVIRLTDGSTRDTSADLRAGAEPERLRIDLGQKFKVLVTPSLNRARTVALRGVLERLDDVDDLREPARLSAPAGG